MMRNIICFFSLIGFLALATPQAYGKAWFVRPADQSYGKGDGTSYEDAWRGLSRVRWGTGGIEPGDTLYICGTHDTDFRNTSLTVKASGTAEAPITVSGDCPGDPGSIWRVNFKITEGWTGPDAFGVYSIRGISGRSRLMYENQRLLQKPMNGPPDKPWEDGAYFHDADSATLYYRPSDASRGGRPEDHLIYTSGGAIALRIEGVEHIAVERLALRHATAYRGVLYLNRAQHIRLSELDVRDGYFCLTAENASRHVTIEDSRFQNCGSGIYAISSHLATQPDDWLVARNTFVEIGRDKLVAGDHKDLHAIGIQGGSRSVFEHNVGYDISGSAITLYMHGDQVMEGNIIRYNFFRDIWSNLHTTKEGWRQGNERGIEFGNTNKRYDAERNKYNQIYGNVIVRARGAALRTKGKTPADGYTWWIYNNTIVEAGQSFEFNDQAAGPDAGFIFENNISLNPTQYPDRPRSGLHISHIPHGGVTHKGVRMSHNIYWPDGRAFMWHNRRYTFEGWLSAIGSQASVGASSKLVDPRIVAPLGENLSDFALHERSPALRAGRKGTLQQDLFGNATCHLADIGAIQRPC